MDLDRTAGLDADDVGVGARPVDTLAGRFLLTGLVDGRTAPRDPLPGDFRVPPTKEGDSLLVEGGVAGEAGDGGERFPSAKRCWTGERCFALAGAAAFSFSSPLLF